MIFERKLKAVSGGPLVALLVAILFAGCSLTQAERIARADQLTSEGRTLYMQGNTEDALEVAMEALEYDPLQIDARRLAADCLFALVHMEEAFDMLLEVGLAFESGPSPESPDAPSPFVTTISASGPVPDSAKRDCLLHAAHLARRLDQPSMAVVYLGYAINVAPGDPVLYRLRGEAQLMCGREHAARASFERALELGGEPDAINGLHAHALFTLEEDEAAIALLEQMKDAGKIDAKELLMLGTLYCRAGRVDDGIECFHNGAAFDPEMAEAHFNRAVAHESQGDLPIAMDAYRDALKIDPCLAAASYHLGQLLLKQDRREEGLALIRAAVQQENDPKTRRAIEEELDKLTKPPAAVETDGGDENAEHAPSETG